MHPIEKTDANTRAVFGDYISIYDIQRAVADKATVLIYYESCISMLSLYAAELPKLDAEFEEIIRQWPDKCHELQAQKLKTKWAALEAMGVCSSRRIVVDQLKKVSSLVPIAAQAPSSFIHKK